MLKSEAFNLIDIAPCDEKPSRINPALTRADAVRIVRAGIGSPAVPDPFDGLMEKRVWQVVHDRKCPRFEKPAQRDDERGEVDTLEVNDMTNADRRAIKITKLTEELDMAKHIIGEFVWPPDATPEQRRCFIQTSARFSGCVIPQYSENDERGEG